MRRSTAVGHPLRFRIATRILLLNVLIAFLPVGSMLLLDTHEQQLLDALERSLVGQGRLIAAALSTAPDGLTAERAQALLRAMAGRHEARLRIVASDGSLLADSATLGLPETVDPQADRAPSRVAQGDLQQPGPRDSLIYRAASFPARTARQIAGVPEVALPATDFYTRASYTEGSEIQAALAGRYGAATRVSAGGQISVTLYSALPIRHGDAVVGAALVSQSTFRILQNLYRIRIDVFRVFLWCLAAAILLSIFLSLTIARPLALLQRHAAEAVDEVGRIRAPLIPQQRRDEIGGLSRSLATLTAQVEGYTRRLEGFAADLSHELKNPLASIAAHCEMAFGRQDADERERFLQRVRADVQRVQAIIEGMRELTRIDAHTEPPARCRVVPTLQAACEAAQSRGTGHAVVVDLPTPSERWEVPLPEHRLYQIVDNVVGNAQSFAPATTTITITARFGSGASGPQTTISVLDEGPGFEEVKRVFDRFYTSRVERNGHLGLGLSIVQSIAESVGGRAIAANRSDGVPGGCVTVSLPTTRR